MIQTQHSQQNDVISIGVPFYHIWDFLLLEDFPNMFPDCISRAHTVLMFGIFGYVATVM